MTRKALIGLPVLIIVIAIVSMVRPRAQAQPSPAPSSYVPFQGTYHRHAPSGESTGTVARASNGSEYRSVDAPFGHYVIIHNFAKHESYELPPGNAVWIIHPMDLQGFDLKPTSAIGRSESTSYTHHGLATVTRAGKTSEAVARTFYAPALNFFEVRREWANGTTEEIDNITQGEPPADLFDIPAGAPSQRSAAPMLRFTPLNKR